MERDAQLKQLLRNGAKDASPDFTETVMKRVNGLSVASLNYRPLVPSKWQRRFLIAYGALAVCTLILSVVMALTHVPVVSWIQSINFSAMSYNRVVVFLFTFWIVFAVNAFLVKKSLSRKRAF